MGVIWTVTKTGVDDVEGEMIVIWSDGDGVSSWHEFGVVDEIVGAASEVFWISA